MIHRPALAFTTLLALAAAITACGGDDDDDDQGSSAAKLESCKQVCDKTATAPCPISLPADTCKQFCDIFAQAPAACQDAVKVVSDCQLAQPDVCSLDACTAEETAYQEACGG